MSDALTAQLALGLSILLALWELRKYGLEGGRVRVRLVPGLLDDYMLRTSNAWEGLASGGASVRAGIGWSVEAAVVEVENRGRTPVTITCPVLDLGATSRWRPWRRRTIGPQPLQAPDASTEWRTRLEPFDSRRYVFDVWSVVAQPLFGDAPPRPLRLRASVQVAGQSRPRRSPWRKGWPVLPGQASMTGVAEVGLAAWRAMWRQTRGEPTARLFCVPVAVKVRERFPADGRPPREDELRAIISETVQGEAPVALNVAALYMAHELQPLYAQPPAPTEP